MFFKKATYYKSSTPERFSMADSYLLTSTTLVSHILKEEFCELCKNQLFVYNVIIDTDFVSNMIGRFL